MNFFQAIRTIAEQAVSAYADMERLEVDVQSATVSNMTGSDFKPRFLVTYAAMTPGGASKQLFVQVQQEGDSMVARHTFSNAAPSFSLQPYRERWGAPRARTQQDALNEAVWANHVARRGA